MKTQRALVLLTVINLLLFTSNLFHANSATKPEVAPMLRGRGLEIVDEHGKMRAQIVLYPASTTKEGEKQPETVLFRLIDPNGRPGVKIGASADGTGMSLAGDSERRDWNGVQILAKAEGTTIKLTNKDGKVQTINP